MKLLIDLGNSRLKWGVTAGGTLPIQTRGSAPYSIEALANLATAWSALEIDTVCYASVVDTAREHAVLSLLPAAINPVRFAVTAQFKTLHNGYGTQETLGLDRWAAAIGAWAQTQAACLVISVGTATTIDLIETTPAGGVYRGGLILPGLDLMRQSLHQGTARLPDAAGLYRGAPDVPDNTADAMASGAIEATCGAIVRMAARLPTPVPWLLTGGGANTLHHALEQRSTLVEDLVLEGLAQI